MNFRVENSDSTGPLLSGPLLGEVSGAEARIWVQARDESELTLTVTGGEEPIVLRACPEKEHWLCTVFTVTGLVPGQTYAYALRSQHGETARYRLRAAAPADAPTARIAFGSCFHDYFTADVPICDAIAREQASAMVLLGDNCYFAEEDWQSEDSMMRCHLRTRNNPALRRLVSETSTLAIYDDHDFGPNDADGNFEGRERALSSFRRVFAQKSYGTPTLPGCFSKVRIGPMELFLTDGRYYRAVGGKTVLGRPQFTWLLDGLRSSRAPVKVVASGTTVLAHHPFYHDWESWRRSAEAELAELLATIEQDEISGVVLISGDLHMGQVRHIAGRKLLDGRQGPDFWEVTSSPLCTDPYNEHVIWPEAALIYQVPDRYNYGLIEVDLARPGAEIVIFLKDSSGQALYRWPIPLDSLRSR